MIWYKGSFCNIIISILFGFFVGYILFYIIIQKSIVNKGPNSNLIKHQVFKHENKCYRMIPKIYLCPIDISLNI